MKKILLGLLGLLALSAGGGYAFLALRSPKVAPPMNVKVDVTAQRVERGKFIFEVLSDCSGCHSERDWTKFAGPQLAGRIGAGVKMPPELGFPGQVVAPNITPDRETGIGTWTDGEKIRAIREGISRDGRALFPFMPYKAFRAMSDEDVYSVVAYMNSLPPVRNELPPTKLSFPVNYLITDAPQPVMSPVAAPSKADPVRYGKYLVEMAGCIECHTQQDEGQPIAGMEFAGGMPFKVGEMFARSANITPEVETGLGAWSEQRFIAKFKGYANLTPEIAPPMNQSNFTLMPWLQLSKLTEEDLRAIYSFLRTVKPVKNAVDAHKPLTQS